MWGCGIVAVCFSSAYGETSSCWHMVKLHRVLFTYSEVKVQKVFLLTHDRAILFSLSPPLWATASPPRAPIFSIRCGCYALPCAFQRDTAVCKNKRTQQSRQKISFYPTIFFHCTYNMWYSMLKFGIFFNFLAIFN
jgi:hypothetical protein